MSLDTTLPQPMAAQALSSVPTFTASIVSIVDGVTSTGGAASTFYKASADSDILVTCSFNGWISRAGGQLSIYAVIDLSATRIVYRWCNTLDTRFNLCATKTITGLAAGQHQIYYAVSFPGFVTTDIKFANINIHDWQTLSLLEVDPA